MLIFAVRSYLTRFNGGVHPVGTLTENRACGLVHFNLIHTTCIRYMYLYFFFGNFVFVLGCFFVFLFYCWVFLCFYPYLMFLSFFLSFFLRVGMFLCVFILLLGFSLFLSLFDVDLSLFLSFFLFFSFLFFSMGKGFWWQREWKLNQKTIIKLLFFISI